jgi:hypothetical protein
MRLHPHEFIRRFLLHVLPKGFHRIRHYGLFAGTAKAEHLATARRLLDMPAPEVSATAAGGNSDANDALNPPCPCCGARMRSEIHPYSMTSSARVSIVGGMLKRRSLAVLRLITSSNFTGCSIGRSPGASPLKILST